MIDFSGKFQRGERDCFRCQRNWTDAAAHPARVTISGYQASILPGLKQPEDIANISRPPPNSTWPRVCLSNVRTSS